jgi:hypothetical protein
MPHASVGIPKLASGTLQANVRPPKLRTRSIPAYGNQAMLRTLPGAALQTKLTVNQAGDAHEREADRVADQVMRMTDADITVSRAPTQPTGMGIPQVPQVGNTFVRLQRQDAVSTDNGTQTTPSADPAWVPPPVTPPAPADAWVCGRPLNYPGLSLAFNHAYVKAPPYTYGIVAPLCTPTDGGSDNLMQGTAASRRDDSCDPGAAKPDCVPCRPKRGVTDIKQCLRDAFSSYNHPTMHAALGPNSNTFAGTLARTCCADIGDTPPFPSGGSYPGWSDPPAPKRAATCPGGPADCS